MNGVGDAEKSMLQYEKTEKAKPKSRETGERAQRTSYAAKQSDRLDMKSDRRCSFGAGIDKEAWAGL